MVFTRITTVGLCCITLLAGCTGTPTGIKPVTAFDLDPYLGTWYEVARLDHRFERGLTHVTANYQLREDGGVAVTNRGFNAQKQTWEQADGRAYFVGNSDIGYLKVSFFGPFFGSYIVFEKDPDSAEYAFVCGPDRSYLWLLARKPAISDALKTRFLQTSAGLGFDTDALIWVDHTPPPTASP